MHQTRLVLWWYGSMGQNWVPYSQNGWLTGESVPFCVQSLEPPSTNTFAPVQPPSISEEMETLDLEDFQRVVSRSLYGVYMSKENGWDNNTLIIAYIHNYCGALAFWTHSQLRNWLLPPVWDGVLSKVLC